MTIALQHSSARPRWTLGATATLAMVMLLLAWNAAAVLLYFSLPTDGWFVKQPDSFGAVSYVYRQNLMNVPSALSPGDHVVAIEGVTMSDDLTNVSPEWRAGNTVRYTAERDGASVNVAVPLTHWQPGPAAVYFVRQMGIANLLGLIVFFLVASLAFFKRPSDHAAQSLLLLATLFIAPSSFLALHMSGPASSVIATASVLGFVSTAATYTVLLPPTLLRFALVFPRPKPLVQRRPWLEYGPYLVGVGVIPLYVLTRGVAGYVWSILSVVGTIGILVHSAVTMRDALSRAQLLWGLWGMVLSLVMQSATFLIAFGVLTGPWIEAVYELSFSVLGVTLGIAILRYRLFDIDVVLNRTLVYGGATATIVIVYAMIVGAFSALFQTQGDPVIAFAAAAIVAVLFQPIRLSIQHGVNRLMYGQRDEPYAVLARFGRQLEATPALETLLPSIVATIMGTLKLPYVAIELAGEAPSERGAADQQAHIPFPLKHQGQLIGNLVVAPRMGEAELSTTDKRLLEDLARQAEVAIHAAGVTADLQHARERLVVAREEERRRIRNDLHDGLAPTLSSLQLQLGAMRNLIRQDPDRAEASAVELREDLRSATAEVRRLVYNLRPPALDDLGLLGAIRSQAQKVSQLDGLNVTVNAPNLPPLPAAVEVAAFRILHEALLNVERHAQARQCVITLTPRESDLTLEIRDDGRGLPPDAPAGVGLRSMRERASELGGEFAASSPAGGGTLVCARLPLKINPSQPESHTLPC